MLDLPVIDSGEIWAASDLAALAEQIRRAYEAGEQRAAVTPARMTVKYPGKKFGAMPSVSNSLGLFVTKLATLVGRSSVQGLVVAMSAEGGEPLAVLDGAALTDLKCAAVTALCTDVCAGEDASTAGLAGTGALAFAQVLGLARVRRLRSLTVYGRDRERAAAFARRVAASLPADARVRLADDIAEVVRGNDIVCTATTSDQPLVTGISPVPGVHVNCMGAHTASSREFDRAFLDGCVLVVEDKPTAVAEAGAVHERALDLSEMLRADRDRLRDAATFFSSTGHAFLDLLTTAHILSALGLAHA